MNYIMSSIFEYFKPKQYEAPSELTHDEIVKYFKDPEYKDYMYGVFYEFTPPETKLDMQLILIWRLFHLKYITYSQYTRGKIDFHPITTKNKLKYQIDSRLFDPRNCEPPYNIQHTSKLLVEFNAIVDAFTWDTVLDIPDGVEAITINNDENDISLNIPLNKNHITVKELCNQIYPYMIQYWINTEKIASVLSENTIDLKKNILTIQIYNHPHVDNNLYKNYMEEHNRLDDFINSGP